MRIHSVNLVECGSCGTKSRSIRYGSAKRTYEHGQIVGSRNEIAAREVQYQHHHDIEQYDTRSNTVGFHSSVHERSEERRSYLQTDREHEQDKSEVLNEIQHVHVLGHVCPLQQVTDKDAHKEYPCHSQTHTLNLQFATQEDAEGNHERVEYHCVCYSTSCQK